MSLDDRSSSPPDVIRDVIRRKARQLIRRAGLPRQDREDIEHDLVTALLDRLRRCRTANGPSGAFVSVVVERLAANLVRNRLAQKRGYRQTRQWPLGLDVPSDAPRDESQTDLQLDVAALLARLPPELRDLAERLMVQTKQAAADDLGVPRTTLATRIRRLRERFEDAGLRRYL